MNRDPIRRFTNRDPLEDEFTWKPRKLTELELEDLDIKFTPIRALTLSGRDKGMLMLVELGAAVERYRDIAVKAEKMQEAQDKIDQWERWRAKKFPAAPRVPFAEWKRRILSKTEVPAPALRAMEQDQAMRDAYPTEEVNPDDIPF